MEITFIMKTCPKKLFITYLFKNFVYFLEVKNNKLKDILIAICLIFIGCGEKDPINFSQLKIVDDYYSLLSNDKPYTGPIFNISGKSEGYLKKGKFEGSFKFFYDNAKKDIINSLCGECHKCSLNSQTKNLADQIDDWVKRIPPCSSAAYEQWLSEDPRPPRPPCPGGNYWFNRTSGVWVENHLHDDPRPPCPGGNYWFNRTSERKIYDRVHDYYYR